MELNIKCIKPAQYLYCFSLFVDGVKVSHYCFSKFLPFAPASPFLHFNVSFLIFYWHTFASFSFTLCLFLVILKAVDNCTCNSIHILPCFVEKLKMMANFNNNQDLMLPFVQMNSYFGAMQCKASSVKMILRPRWPEH